MDEVKIPLQSILIGNGDIQNTGTGWSGTGALRYNLYVIPDDSNLDDAISNEC